MDEIYVIFVNDLMIALRYNLFLTSMSFFLFAYFHFSYPYFIIISKYPLGDLTFSYEELFSYSNLFQFSKYG